MYLSARKFTTEYSFPEHFNKLKKELGVELKSDFPSIIIEVSAAYWRKANHIHKWFVDNVQYGKDDCGQYSISREELTSLLSVCKEVYQTQESSKPELVGAGRAMLPRQEGFFFGSSDYDEAYMFDITDTIEQIEYVLETFKYEDGWSFVYQSSW